MPLRSFVRPLIVAITLAIPAAVAPSAGASTSLVQRADAAMRSDASSFVARRTFSAPFDWSQDGCSNPLPINANDLFRVPCMQHDFGYRNYGARGRLRLDPSSDRRRWIDDRFLGEMRGVCDRRYGGARRTACRGVARAYWAGVRTFGSRAFGY
ncbi:MAG: phospholipase A2 [Solirubrobacteraceae bacterium]